jgi:hypothetical protein
MIAVFIHLANTIKQKQGVELELCRRKCESYVQVMNSDVWEHVNELKSNKLGINDIEETLFIN